MTGEFEELGREDLKSFLLMPKTREEHSVPPPDAKGEMVAAQAILKRIFPNKSNSGTRIVAPWDPYGLGTSATACGNPLEILDPLMQEALLGAGQKIRGSVLIEQQVRNMMYASTRNDEDLAPTCPVEIGRAFELLTTVMTLVAKSMSGGSVPPCLANSALFQQAKKTDPVHAELLHVVFRVAQAAVDLRATIIAQVDLEAITAAMESRIAVKAEHRSFLNGVTQRDHEMQEVEIHGLETEIFRQVRSFAPSSASFKQLKLVEL